MKAIFSLHKPLLLTAIICLLRFSVIAQAVQPRLITALRSDPWMADQLIEPAILVQGMNDASSSNPVILNIGAVEDIKGATHIGAVSTPENLKKLAATVAALPKDKPVIIYCGCCPFAKCPNIRPAYNELKKLGFTNVKVLNLPVNLQTDWIGKGYPLAAR